MAWPMMLGTDITIDSPPPSIGPQRLPELTASTSAPNILTVERQEVDAMCRCPGSLPTSACASATLSTCEARGGFVFRSYRFHVTAVAAGESFLVLTDGAGHVYDRIGLEVRAPAQLTIEQQLRDEPSGDTVRTSEVSAVSLHLAGGNGVNGGFWFEGPVRVQARDRHGNPLAAGAIDQAITNVDVAEFDGSDPRFTTRVTTSIIPKSIGTTELTVSAGAVSRTVPLRVK